METARKKLLEFLKMGIGPEQLALSIAMGVALGLVPALGIATLLCTAAAFLFRLNLPTIQLVNFIVYPLQLALLLPFIRAGEWLFGAEPLDLSLDIIRRMIEADLLVTIISLSSATMRAFLVWLLVAPVMVALGYFAMTPILRRLNLEQRNAG